MRTSGKQIISFDLLRIYACACILAVHVALFFHIPGKLGELMAHGSSGLNIFFVLSGYLNLASLEKSASIKNWYKKRLVRIIPIYYAVLLAEIIIFEFILKGMPQDPNGMGWLGYFLCLNKIFPYKEKLWVNLGGVASISIFVWFYLLTPFFHKFVNNLKRSVVFLCVTYLLARGLLAFTEWGSVFASFYYFAIGIVAYYAVKEAKEKEVIRLGLLVVCGLMFVDAQGGLTYALVIGLIMIASRDIVINNEKVCRWISGLSRVTFCVYLAHGLAIEILDWVYTGDMIGKVLAFVGMTLVITAFLYYCVEKVAVYFLLRAK